MSAVAQVTEEARMPCGCLVKVQREPSGKPVFEITACMDGTGCENVRFVMEQAEAEGVS